MKTCCVPGCVSDDSQASLDFFEVPKNHDRRATWLVKIQRLDVFNKSRLFICEKHFEISQLFDTSWHKNLCPNAMPTLFLPGSDGDDMDAPVASTSTGSYNASLKRQLDDPEYNQIDKVMKIKEELFDWEHDQVEILNPHQVETIPEVSNALRARQKRSPKKPLRQTFKLFALNMYFASPVSYRALQSSFGLPPHSTLYRLCVPTTTDLSQEIITVLKIKVDCMTEVQKLSVLCISTMSLEPTVYYDDAADKIRGLHEVDGVQKLEPATTVLLITVRGLLDNWQQVVAILFLSKFQTYHYVKMFIENVISKLLQLGFKVRALLTDLETEQFTMDPDHEFDLQTPFFKVDHHKIYYMYDPLYLMKNIRNKLMTHNIVFYDKLKANWQYIENCYSHDVKRGSLRIAPKLCPNDMPVENLQDDLKKTRDLFSKATATAISIYVQLKLLPPDAMQTVQWLGIMNKLIDMLNFSTINPPEDKRALFSGNAVQSHFLISMLSFFLKFTFEPGVRKISYPKFIESFRITINAILMLSGELRGYKCKVSALVGLSRDCVDQFFQKVCEKYSVTRPTVEQIITCMTEFPIFNIFTNSCNTRISNDLEVFMSRARRLPLIKKYINVSKTEKPDININDAKEFSMIVLREKHFLKQLSLYLLCKGYQQHSDCDKMKIHVYGAGAMNQEVLQLTDSGITINTDNYIVPEKFLEFVSKLEATFKTHFTTNNLIRPLLKLEKYITRVMYDMPCACFPINYIKKLFMRFRLHLVLEHNNKMFKNANRNVNFVVNDLFSL